MADLVLGSAWYEQGVRGVVFRRSYQCYENATAASSSCAAPSKGDGIDLSAYPFLVCSVRTPGGVVARCPAQIDQVVAPAVVTFTVERDTTALPFDEGETVLTLTLLASDGAGNELPLIEAGVLAFLQGGL